MNAIVPTHPFETGGSLAFDAYSSETNHIINGFHHFKLQYKSHSSTLPHVDTVSFMQNGIQ